MKKLRVILPAILTLAVSTSAAVTGTVAWFIGRNIVSVTGIKMQATGEDGIVIAQETSGALESTSWKTTVAALHTGAGESFIPATTKALNVSTGWRHGTAVSADQGVTGATLEDFNITPATVGDADSVATGTSATQVVFSKNVYLYNEFYIQAASKQTLNSKLYVKNITCQESGTAQDINKSLRIAFKINNEVKVYCPLLDTGFTGTANSYEAAYQSLSDTTPNEADYIYTTNPIPAYSETGASKLTLQVFCWFEGEDTNCKTDNLQPTFNNITLGFDIAHTEPVNS